MFQSFHEEEAISFEEFSKKKSRTKREKREQPKIDDSFELKTIYPKTENQKSSFEFYSRGNNLLLHGSAGTGKTFISLYLALRSVIVDKTHRKIAIVRSAVPTRDIGFLPGNAKDKMAVYEAPYQAIFTELFGRADAYNILKLKKYVEFIPTSFVRGITLDDTIIIVDEMSNMSGHELDSIITRVGDRSRIIFSGDFSQSDLKSHEKKDFFDFIKVLDSMKSFRHVEFNEDDIVRSSFVKDYIVNKNRLKLNF